MLFWLDELQDDVVLFATGAARLGPGSSAMTAKLLRVPKLQEILSFGLVDDSVPRPVEIE